GHNHNYVRCVVDGITHITTGGGGAPLDAVDFGMPYVVAGEGNTLSYCKIDVQGYDLTFTAVRSPENTVIESFTLHHEVPNPPDPATNPDPADLATDVSIFADISWDAGAYAVSHDVYFGTDPTPDAGEFMGNQTGTTYDPGTLSTSTTYYWAIDEVNPVGTTTGSVWSFTTQDPTYPGAPSGPDPANGITDVGLTGMLSWTAGADTDDYDVYFGTNPTPTDWLGNTSNTTIDPGALSASTTYYWQVVANNYFGSTAGPIWEFTTMPPDLTAPTPDPATFASAPAAISSSEITMTATTGSDPTGPVEYYFDEVSGNAGGSDSGWQTSASYTDTGLVSATQYTYTVTMRDGVGNEGGASAPSNATTFDFDPIFINFQPAASPVPSGYLADDGSVYGDRGNGYTYGWDTLNAETRDRGIDTDQRYDTLNHLQKSGASHTWEIEIDNGTYDIDVVFGDPGYTDQVNHMNVEGVLLNDPDGQDNFDEHFGVTVVVSDGRLTVSHQGSAVNSKICYIDIYAYIPPDVDPPTPNPATFAVAPAADSETAISMTATIGSDVSGPVEYLFTCTAGGGNDSGWQTSDSYTDSGLSPGTQYCYTVTMRDSYGNTGTASTPSCATTDADINPPTPNPATFALAPSADSDTTISMMATTGSDVSGPVQYYFDEISGNPGGTDSGWQSSTSYADTGLTGSTEYTYTVQMRDSLLNTGIVSGALSATTPAIVPDVTGQAQATAESNIVAANLVVGTVTTSYSFVVPAGDVISQNPTGGASVPPGTSVDIEVSLGVEMVTVPDVVGLAQATAESDIVAVGLVVGTVTTSYSETVPAGDVISQNPAGGASVEIASSVDIEVSLGVEPVTVPDVVGLA
ncbi:MAG: hypothetical protein DRH17_14110, partial [Deltaproteobacteria bacterium]